MRTKRKKTKGDRAIGAAPDSTPPAFGLGSPAALIEKGPSKIVPITKSAENWSEFTLADGSKVRLRPIVASVRHIVGQYNAQGDPVYVLQATMVVDTIAAENLRQGYSPPKSSKRRKKASAQKMKKG
jgi:hypothetical protein